MLSCPSPELNSGPAATFEKIYHRYRAPSNFIWLPYTKPLGHAQSGRRTRVIGRTGLRVYMVEGPIVWTFARLLSWCQCRSRCHTTCAAESAFPPRRSLGLDDRLSAFFESWRYGHQQAQRRSFRATYHHQRQPKEANPGLQLPRLSS